MKRLLLVTAVTATAIFLNSCSSDMERKEIRWGYNAENGPSVWGRISPEYILCSEGRRQSPIDLADASPKRSPRVIFDYRSSPLTVVNNGRTVQVSYEEGSSIEVEGARYGLLQFHFHSPSEHTLSGETLDMEMHLVHRNASSGELAVVGALVRRGSENAAFAPVWENMPAEAGEPRRVNGVSINAEDMLPSERLFYRYDGSLTTPPCSEGVKWFVLTTPIEMSAAQIEMFRSVINGNNRPVQPLNERELCVDVPEEK